MLLDTGSTHTFVTKEVARQFRSKDQNFTLDITVLGDEVAETVPVHSISNFIDLGDKCDVCVVGEITSTTSAPALSQETEQKLAALPFDCKLTDSYPRGQEPVHILLGSDLLWKATISIHKIDSNAAVIRTIWGDFLTGKLQDIPPERAHVLFSTLAKENVTNSELNEILNSFWSTENIDQPENVSRDSGMTEGEKYALDYFNDNLTFKDGMYYTRLLFRPDRPKMKNNLRACLARFRNLDRQLANDPLRRNMYQAALAEYIYRGDAELVPLTLEQALKEIDDPSKEINYLPARPVFDMTRTTTRCRVTFDGSSGPKGQTLNSLLLPGPRMQLDPVQNLINFRLNRTAFTADVSKFFLSCGIQEEDRDFLRFLFRDIDGHVKIARMRTVGFGNRDSPFLSDAVLRQHCAQFHKKDPTKYERAAFHLDNRRYVDDLCSGASNAQEANAIRKEITSLLQKGNFSIKKWATNDSNFLKMIPVDDRAPFETEEDGTLVSEPIKVLGLKWIPSSDKIHLKLLSQQEEIEKAHLTKRLIASVTPSIYDPLGLLSPFVMQGKLLLHEAWKTTADWDTKLPDSFLPNWQQFIFDIPNMQQIQLPRFIPGASNKKNLSIVTCTDASKTGLGIVSYLRIGNKVPYSLHFLMARSATPNNMSHSIPKKELEALRRGIRVTEYLGKVLEVPVKKRYLFSDSQVCIAWTKKDPLDLKTFESNVVKEFLKSKLALFYVNTKYNPADIVSRGATIEQIKDCDIYLKGPEFLLGSEKTWPDYFDLDESSCKKQIDEGVKNSLKRSLEKRAQSLFSTAHQDRDSFDKLFRNVSSWMKAIRVIARIQKLFRKDKDPFINKMQFDKARDWYIKKIQNQFFQKEIDCLLKKVPLPSKSPILALNPYMDQNGLLRVGGRLQVAIHLPFESRHQVILPENCMFTMRLMEHTHLMNHHSPPMWTLAFFRESYWINKGKLRAKMVLRTCVPCQKMNKPVAQQIMSFLPHDRVTPAQPFEVTSCDLAGPFLCKTILYKGRASRGRDPYVKVWITIFTCCTTRAVHLELLVGNCETATFLAVLKRLIARRGAVRTMYSDQGGYFTKADKHLQAVFENLREDPKLQNFLTMSGLTWKFNVPQAPHRMAIHERLIRTMKSALYINSSSLDKSMNPIEFNDLLISVESLLNRRPLVPLSSNVHDFQVLTPANFLMGKNIQLLPHLDVQPKTNLSSNELKRFFHKRELLVDTLWSSWNKLYLQELQHRQKWRKETTPLKVNQLVLLVEPNLKRNHWPLARVLEVIPGSDHKIRIVKIKTTNNVLKRAVSSVVPLEFNDDENDLPDVGLDDHSANNGRTSAEMETLPGGIPEGHAAGAAEEAQTNNDTTNNNAQQPTPPTDQR